jgi:hypothetical protein
VIEDGSRIGSMVRRQVAMYELMVLAMFILLVDVLWRQPDEPQYGGDCQPYR